MGSPHPRSFAALVRAACLELVAAGTYPSLALVAARFPGANHFTLKIARLRWLHDPGVEIPPAGRAGPRGPAAAELKAIAGRTAEVRAEKAARGEPPRRTPPGAAWYRVRGVHLGAR